MKMKFNKDRCLKLLKEKKSLEREGKLLRDYDKAKNDELISYFIMVEDQIFWQSRKEYRQILEFFVSKKITVDQFIRQFSRLRTSNLNSPIIWQNNLEDEARGSCTQSNKIDFQLNPESGKFTKIICNLYSLIDLYDPDVTLEMNLETPESISYALSEEYLRFIIEEDFLPQLEKYCNKS